MPVLRERSSRDTSRGNATKRMTHRYAALATTCITFAMAWAIAEHFELGPVDDAYISLRYADNWANGRGLCFNPEQRVEGYTNFLLVAIQATTIRCGADPVVAMSAISRLAHALLAGVFTLFVAEHVFRRRLLFATVAGVLFGLNAVLLCWGTSGLESCMYALLLLTSVMFAVARGQRFRPVLSAVFLILAGMTRPEAAAMLPVLLLIVYLRRRSLRPVVMYAAVFVIGFGAYFAIRAAHFGYLFPNTFYAKLDYGNTQLGRRGLQYAWDFATGMWPLMALIVVAVGLIRRAPLWAKALMMTTVLQGAVIVYEGGDHFAMFRFMVPVLPFLIGAALYPYVWVTRRYRLPEAKTSMAAMVVFAAVALSGITVGSGATRAEANAPPQFQRYQEEAKWTRQWCTIGRWLRGGAALDTSVSTVAIGAIAYHSDLVIVDPHGIVEAGVAHQKQDLGGGYAGHEKYDVNAVLAKRPGYLLLLNLLTPKAVPEDRVADHVWGTFNAEIVRDARLQRNYRYESIPFGDEYLNLHIRRDLPTPASPSRKITIR